jgi:hypothetical protein
MRGQVQPRGGLQPSQLPPACRAHKNGVLADVIVQHSACKLSLALINTYISKLYYNTFFNTLYLLKTIRDYKGEGAMGLQRQSIT